MSEQMPFENYERPFAPLATAAGVQAAPDPIDLGEEVPVAANPYEIDRRAVRHVIFVGDVITPIQKKERSDLRLGGEYLGQQFKTLVRTKGCVRRCQISPMEIAFDFISDEMLGDNKTGLQIVGTVQHGKEGSGNALFGSRKLNAVEVFPGDEIKGLLRINRDTNHGPRGFYEVKTLAGMSVQDVRAAKIQEFIFPYWSELIAGLSSAAIPTVLSQLVAQLGERRRATNDATMHEIIDTYLQSAEDYRNWGVSYLKLASSLVRLPAHQGHVHTYSPLAEMLFEQLEVMPTDEILRNPTQVNVGSNEAAQSEMRDLMARMVAVQEALAAQGQGPGVGVQTVGAATPAPDPDDPERPNPFDPQPEHTDVKETPVIQPPDTNPNPNPPATPPAEPELPADEVRCTAINSTTNERCRRIAVAGGRCEHPAHKVQ